MTWEETINYIRTNSDYTKIVESGYYNPDLVEKQKYFYNSRKLKEIIQSINKYSKEVIPH